MKKNLFFDVGSTLLYPKTKEWFIPPNYKKILGDIDTNLFKESIDKNKFLLDERNINTEEQEFEMFSKFYYNVLKDFNYSNITTEIIQNLAYDCVYNDDKFVFYKEVKREIKNLSKEYDMYIISDAWPSTYRILKNYGIYDLFKNVYISSDLGFKKSDKMLFEIALENISSNDINYFIDDRFELLKISERYGFIPIIIDRNDNELTNYIEVRNLTQLRHLLKIKIYGYNP